MKKAVFNNNCLNIGAKDFERVFKKLKDSQKQTFLIKYFGYVFENYDKWLTILKDSCQTPGGKLCAESIFSSRSNKTYRNYIKIIINLIRNLESLKKRSSVKAPKKPFYDSIQRNIDVSMQKKHITGIAAVLYFHENFTFLLLNILLSLKGHSKLRLIDHRSDNEKYSDLSEYYSFLSTMIQIIEFESGGYISTRARTVKDIYAAFSELLEYCQK
ncbi:MAG TPA: hypothetical protein PK720_03230 [bacterium]|nr:hypothetical protein [bacterium]